MIAAWSRVRSLMARLFRKSPKSFRTWGRRQTRPRSRM